MNLITLVRPAQPRRGSLIKVCAPALNFRAVGKELAHDSAGCAVDGEGEKSNVVANVAAAMAMAGDRVILVDGDLRKPHQHEIFGVANATGLAQWIDSGGPPPLLESTIDKLRVLPSGPSVINPVALLSTKRLGERLAELVALADYVIIDAPPLLHVTDAALWASQVDGVVLLVNGGTPAKKEQAPKTG